jgi:hypothetical protein
LRIGRQLHPPNMRALFSLARRLSVPLSCHFDFIKLSRRDAWLEGLRGGSRPEAVVTARGRAL